MSSDNTEVVTRESLDKVIKERIIRYLYLGTVQPFYIRQTQPLDIELGSKILKPIKDLVDSWPEEIKAEKKTTDEGANLNQDQEKEKKKPKSKPLGETPTDILKQVFSSGALWRHDEALFMLAYISRVYKTQDDRHDAYQLVTEFIKTAKDLFQYLYFYKTLLGKEKGKCCFGNGVKKALIRWYNKHTAVQLAQMFALDRTWFGWCHKDILVMIHMKTEDKAKMQVIDAATGGKGLIRVPKDTQSSGEKASEDQQEQSEAVKIYRQWRKFKSVNNAHEACKGIRDFGFPFQLLPTQLHRAMFIWETVIPRMQYRDVVHSSLVLQDYKMLKDESNLLKVFGDALNNMTAVKQSKLHPIFIYQTMRLFEERQRYLNIIKEAVHTANNLGLKNIIANPVLMRYFYNALNESMLNHKRTNLNFFITLDLRSKHCRKSVFGNRLLSCLAAHVLLTFPILKREQHVRVMSFTEQPDVLKDVNFTREMKFFEGFEHIQANSPKKNKVDIKQPIEYAQKGKQKVDVFITIVDSLIRVNPMQHSPIERLRQYNLDKNANACYIIINLSRHKQDLSHKEHDDTKGIMELVGFTEDTPKLIDAYIQRHFV